MALAEREAVSQLGASFTSLELARMQTRRQQ